MKIELKKIKNFFKKLPRILGEKAFFTFLFLLFLDLISGGLIFYKYSFLASKAEPEVTGIEQPIQFKENAYQEVIKTWQARQKQFEETTLKEYPDLFRKATTTATTTGG